MGIMRENGAYEFFYQSGVSMSKVLEKLLKPTTESELLEKYLKPQKAFKPVAKKPGRPKVAEEKKARNFTLCLAPQYVEFLDKMTVKNTKIKGRGRKIRFIIERFIEHEKRSLGQLKFLREALARVQELLQSKSGRVKKGERLELTPREHKEISGAVDQVHLLMKILQYSPKSLHKILPREEWALLSFCLDWKANKGITL